MSPPEERSAEAVALREAAAAWGENLHREPRDDEDSDSKRLNRALLFAALRYAARVVSGLPAAELRRFARSDVASWRSFMAKNGHAVGAAIRSFAERR